MLPRRNPDRRVLPARRDIGKERPRLFCAYISVNSRLGDFDAIQAFIPIGRWDVVCGARLPGAGAAPGVIQCGSLPGDDRRAED